MKNKLWIVGIVLIALAAAGYLYRNQLTDLFMKTPTTQNGLPLTGKTVVLSKTTAENNTFLTDNSGRTLYIFDKDSPGTSNCVNDCLKKWPPYIARTTITDLPPTVTTITRKDGALQYAYNGLPLYYFDQDKNPGDVLGDNVGGVWHLVHP